MPLQFPADQIPDLGQHNELQVADPQDPLKLVEEARKFLGVCAVEVRVHFGRRGAVPRSRWGRPGLSTQFAEPLPYPARFGVPQRDQLPECGLHVFRDIHKTPA